LLAYIYALFHAPSYRGRYADELRTGFPRMLPPDCTVEFEAMAKLGRELIDLHLLRRERAGALAPTRTLPLSSSIASFRVGGYATLKKWLQPSHRSTDDPEYGRIAGAIARTLEIMAAIDAIFKRSYPDAAS
jgi:hypothetical protein